MDRKPRTRREVLRAAGVLTGGAALAQLGVPAIGTARSAMTLASLERRLGGTLIEPGDATYGAAAALWNTRLSLNPRAIAFCQSVRDVQEVVRFARERGWPISARSGRHSFEGYSNASGIVCDVSQMAGVRFDRTHGTVKVGPGNNVLSIFNNVVLGAGRGMLNGSCPTVGIAGLALGGGLSRGLRQHGALVDDMVGASVVLPDGRYVQASAKHRPELFWALRGGGGGNFGIVTSFTFRTHSTPDPVEFGMSFDWSKAAEMYAAWQTLAPAAPSTLASCSLRMTRTPPTSGSGPYLLKASVGGLWNGSQADLADLLAPLTAIGPSSSSMNTTTYAEAWHPDGCTIGVGGSLTCKPTVLYPNYQRSDFFTEPMPAPGIDELITQVENWPGGPGSDEGGVQIEALGPGSKSNAVASDATAFVHRKTLYHTVYLNFWGEPASEAANVAWVDDIYAAMRPYASGQAYQNYIDAGLDSWRTAYYGSNWKRLQRVKRAYDPANLLSFAQGVTPAR